MTITALVALAAPSLASAAVETLVLRSQAFPMKPYQVVQGMTAVPSPRVDGYVTGMTVEVVDTAGRVQTMNDVMLHHAVFVKALVPDYTCGRFYDYDRRPSPLPAERFFGAGEEHMELHLPDGYGYANRGTDIWGLVYMLMNHRNAASTVHVQYRIQYVTGEPRTPVKPVWLDVVNCYADPIFTVPGDGGPGSSFVRTSDFTMPESGRLVSGGAHIHGGGQRIELRNATCSTRELFTSRPSWPDHYPLPMMHEPGPAHMTSWSDAAGIPVAAGETLRLRAVYDNSRPHMRVMGIMIAWLAPGSTPACAPTPALSRPAARPGADAAHLPTAPAQPCRQVRAGQADGGHGLQLPEPAGRAQGRLEFPVALPRHGAARRHARERPRGPRLGVGAGRELRLPLPAQGGLQSLLLAPPHPDDPTGGRPLKPSSGLPIEPQ